MVWLMGLFFFSKETLTNFVETTQIKRSKQNVFFLWQKNKTKIKRTKNNNIFGNFIIMVVPFCLQIYKKMDQFSFLQKNEMDQVLQNDFNIASPISLR